MADDELFGMIEELQGEVAELRKAIEVHARLFEKQDEALKNALSRCSALEVKAGKSWYDPKAGLGNYDARGFLKRRK